VAVIIRNSCIILRNGLMVPELERGWPRNWELAAINNSPQSSIIS
jgi:hypothetical protein